VSDIVRAVLTAHAKNTAPFTAYNVATGDYITVAEIAALAVECVGLPREKVAFAYTGGDRGWKGDVPIVRLDTARIKGLGWRCEHSSRQALQKSMLAMIPDMKAGKM
jgi:UDP-glucose 4-epimerase